MGSGDAGKFFCDEIELCEILAAKALLENGRKPAASFGKEREVAFGAADVTGQYHWTPQYKLKKKPLRCATACGLRRVPLPTIAFEQRIRFLRPPTARRVMRDGGGLCGAPHIENRFDQRPGRFDAVTTIEQRGVTAEAIVDQRSVRASRRIAKSFTVAEIHGDVADAHFRAGALCTKGDGNPFVRLNVQDEAVGFGFTAAKDDVRSTLVLDDDLGSAFGKTFAGAEIKRNVGPAPIVDEEFCGDERFCA